MPCPRCEGPEISDKVLRLIALRATCLKREKELPGRVTEALKSVSDDVPWHFCARCTSTRAALGDYGTAEFHVAANADEAFNVLVREQKLEAERRSKYERAMRGEW